MIMDIFSMDLWVIALLIARFNTAQKYVIQGLKIKEIGTSKGHSRKFGNKTILADTIMLGYFIFKTLDWYMVATTTVIIIADLFYWYQVYIYYPYKRRGLRNFRRPDTITYFINSILPNSLRRRL
jgi:hypothetical protein